MAQVEVVSIPGLVLDAAERFAGREALVDGTPDGAVRLTFPQLADEMRRSTRAAVAAGLQPGDRASVWAPNIHEWILAALGVLGAGGVLVPLNTRFKGAEAAYVLRKSGARMLFTVTGFLDTDYVEMLRGSGEDVPALERIVVLRGDAPEGTTPWADYLAAGESVPAADADARIAAVASDDLSDIIFTSGTTGRPKGAMVTHGQSLKVYDAWTEVIGLREGDRYLIVNPFFHTFGYKAGWMSCIVRGATIVPHAVFDVPAVLARVAEERHHGAAGAADAAPGHPQLPRPRQVRSLDPAAHRHRRRGRSRRAHQAAAQRDDVRDDHHRLRAHRDDRHRDDVPSRRRPGDDRELVGTGDPGYRGPHRRRRRQRAAPDASPARS